MKLAFCLFNYFPYGGLQRDFMRIAKECLRRGHEIDVYTMNWEGLAEPGLAITLISPKGWQNHTRIANFSNQVQKYIKKNTYDLVIGFNKMPGLDIYFAADICFQAKIQQKWYRSFPRYRALLQFEKTVFNSSSHTQILHLTQQQKSDFTHFYGTQTERFHLLPPGIAKNRLPSVQSYMQRKKLREQLKMNDDEFLLLMVGSGFKAKGLDRALIGFAHLPDAIKQRSKLMIVGDDYSAAYIRLAKKLGIESKVQFLGGRMDVTAFFLAADLLVHPAYQESAGMVLLEAIISGLPILTTDVCGYAHYVNEAKAGVVLPSPFSQQQFNEQLLNMLLSTKKAEWKKNGRLFGTKANIYNMPLFAANIIESLRF